MHRELSKAISGVPVGISESWLWTGKVPAGWEKWEAKLLFKKSMDLGVKPSFITQFTSDQNFKNYIKQSSFVFRNE